MQHKCHIKLYKEHSHMNRMAIQADAVIRSCGQDWNWDFTVFGHKIVRSLDRAVTRSCGHKIMRSQDCAVTKIPNPGHKIVRTQDRAVIRSCGHKIPNPGHNIVRLQYPQPRLVVTRMRKHPSPDVVWLFTHSGCNITLIWRLYVFSPKQFCERKFYGFRSFWPNANYVFSNNTIGTSIIHFIAHAWTYPIPYVV